MQYGIMYLGAENNVFCCYYFCSLRWIFLPNGRLFMNKVESVLLQFIQRSRLCWNANLTNQEQIKGEYLNTHYTGKYGTTTPGNTTYLVFLNYGQEIQNGIYPVILFNKTNQKLEVCYGISEKNSPETPWESSLIANLPNSISQRYSTSKVLKTFDIPEEENKIKQIIPSMIECIDKIIDDFHILFREHQNLTYWAVGSDWGRNQGNQQKRFLNDSIWEDGYGANGKEKYKKRLDSVKIGDIFVLKSASTVGTGHKTPITIIKNIGIVQERKNFWSFKVKWLNIPTHPYKIEGKVLWATISEIEDQGILHMIKNLISGEETAMNSADILTNFPLNQILFGPPGTGKTYHTILKAMEIINKKEYSEEEEKNNYQEIKTEFDVYKKKGQIKFITFHQNYSYEDFVGGIRPVLSGNTVSYYLYEGPFKEIAEKARQDKNNNYVLIIDEINRGNISKIFGELITLIEEDKREGQDHELSIPLMYHEEGSPEFTVPTNLYIIGTMNTADKSIAFVDFALRRRFVFEEMMPDPELLDDSVIKTGEFSLKEWFRQTNEIIKKELDKDHQIGHSYFLPKPSKEFDLKYILDKCIIPLLQEYCYGEPDKLRKILPNFFDEQGLLAIQPKQFIETLVQKNKNASSN